MNHIVEIHWTIQIELFGTFGIWIFNSSIYDDCFFVSLDVGSSCISSAFFSLVNFGSNTTWIGIWIGSSLWNVSLINKFWICGILSCSIPLSTMVMLWTVDRLCNVWLALLWLKANVSGSRDSTRSNTAAATNVKNSIAIQNDPKGKKTVFLVQINKFEVCTEIILVFFCPWKQYYFNTGCFIFSLCLFFGFVSFFSTFITLRLW